MYRHTLILIWAFILPSATFANSGANSETSEAGILDKWSSPLRGKTSKTILLSGLGLAGFLYAERTKYGDPLQENWSEDEPMGDLADFGDIMGQLVPNLTYIGVSHLTGNKSKRNLMFDSTLYAGASVVMLKHLVGEERPDGSNNLSFPSGHTATAFAFAGVVGIEHEWYWAVPAYGLAAVVGASRINDNAHYLHDVAAGAAIGLAYAYGLDSLRGRENAGDLAFIPLEGGGYFNYAFRL